MCGIAGVVRIHNADHAPPPPLDAIPGAWLDTLSADVGRRGPDAHARWRRRISRDGIGVIDVAFVHHRLSIIDHAGGAQPMVRSPEGVFRSQTYAPNAASIIHESDAPDDRHAMVFNGCVYDHADARARLAARGATFTSDHADTETLLAGLALDGPRFLDTIDSMHALALWSEPSCSLTLSRDRFGQKPLYFTRFTLDGAPYVAFASLPTPLAQLASAPLDAAAMAEWIARGYHPTRTPWAGVTQLSPGESLTWNLAADSQILEPEAVTIGAASASGPHEHFAETLEAAVASHLIADVPVACLLSGGIDSSAVALAAGRSLPDARSLRTVCVRMSHNAYDESRFAESVATAIGSDHLTIDASADPAADLVRLIEALGLPFGDSSLLPTHWAFRAAGRDAKAVLTGDGGDEMFMGYDRYRAISPLRAARALAFAEPLCSRLLSRHNPKSKSERAARLLSAARYAGYHDILDIFPTPDRVALLPGGASEPREPIASPDAARRFDIAEHLPGDMLRKVDHASALVPVEARAPLLSRAIAAFITRSPQRPTRPSKQALRSYLADHMPPRLFDRPKSGFALPLGSWLRPGGSLHDALHDHLGASEPFPGLAGAGLDIDRTTVHRFIDEHNRARGREHSQRLYQLLVLSIWARAQNRNSSAAK